MYQNGKIYKLVSDNTDKIYIGSTCNPLYKRLGHHKNDNKRKEKILTSKELTKFDDCKIILIEDFPCERKEQLTARERYHIEQNKDICVNKQIPTRTSKEYRQQNIDKKKEYDQQNKDKIVEYKKEWYQQNKYKRAEQMKEYRQQNKDKIKEYFEKNKDKLVKQKKEYYEQNKDKIKERRRLKRLEQKNIEQDNKEDGYTTT